MSGVSDPMLMFNGIEGRSKGLHKGPRKILRLCLLSAVVPIILICLLLYMKFHKFGPRNVIVTSSDNIVLQDNVSSFWCQACVVRMNHTANTFLFHNHPTLSGRKQKLQQSDSIFFKGEMSKYWMFYLQEDSSVQIKSCARWPGSIMMIAKGEKNFNSCLFLNEDNSMESTSQDEKMILKHVFASRFWENKNGSRSFLTNSDPSAKGMFAQSCQSILAKIKGKKSRPFDKLLEKICLSLFSNSKNDAEQQGPSISPFSTQSSSATSGRPTVGHPSNSTEQPNMLSEDENSGANVEVPELTAADKPNRHARSVFTREISDDEANELFLNFLINGHSTRNNIRSKRSLYEMHKHPKSSSDTKRSLEQNVDTKTLENIPREDAIDTASEKIVNPNDLSDGSEIMDDSDVVALNNEEQTEDYDEDFFNLLMEENESSVSSSEEARDECLKVKELFAALKPSRLCSENYNSHWEEFTYLANQDGYYYLIFANDNEISGNEIHFQLDVQRAVYNLSTNSNACYNMTECHLPLSFSTSQFILVQDYLVETFRTVSSAPEQQIEIECEHRTAVYVTFVVITLFLAIFCAYN